MSLPRRLRLRLAAASAAALPLLLGTAPAAAQQDVLDQDAVPLTLKKISDVENGTAALLQGEAGPEGDRFFVENLNITQPISVILMAADPGRRPLALNLSKYRFDQSDRDGDTGASGMVAFDFRTQGELKIQVKPVSSDETARAPYFLIVWAGEDLTPADLPMPVVSASMVGGGGGSGGMPSWLLLLGGVIGGAILVLAALGLRSLRGGPKAMIILLVAAGVLAPPMSLFAGATPLGSLADLRSRADLMEREGEQAAEEREVAQARRSAIDEGFGHLDTAMDLYEKSRAFTEGDAALADVLNPDDNAFDPDFDPDGAPSLPSHCATEGGEDCGCYQDAYKKLNFARFYLERLRAIYGATKNYTDQAIAFGDAMAGINGGFGVAWPPERKGIQEAFDNLGHTYDGKYDTYMDRLREALNAISACEQEHHDVDDWYNRFGFIYYSFMRDRYKR